MATSGSILFIKSTLSSQKVVCIQNFKVMEKAIQKIGVKKLLPRSLYGVYGC